MPSYTELDSPRRQFLAKLATGAGLGILVNTGCGTTTTQETKPVAITTKGTTKEASPTTATKKETLPQTILWTEQIVLPTHPSDLRLTREAFFTTDSLVFFTNSQGQPTVYNLEKGRAWRWEEDQALVYGTDQNSVYAFRRDNRLFALNAQTGQRKWNTVFPTMANANVEWPFLICKDTVHPKFRPSQQQFPFASISKRDGEVLWISNGSTKAIGSTPETIVTEDWPGWGRWHGVDPASNKIKWSIRFEGYFDPKRGVIVDKTVFWISPRQGVQGQLTAVDIDSGQDRWVNNITDTNSILFVSPTRVYTIWWITSLNQPGLLVVDRKTGTTVMQEREFHKEDSIDEKEDWFIWTQSRLGQTTFINVVNGATATNDDLRLTGLVGTVRNIMVGFYADPNRRQSFLYGIDITSKKADRKWRVPVEQTNPPPVIVKNKVVYSSGKALEVLDAQTGSKVSTVALSGATRIEKRKDILLVQTGNPGRVGSLSAVRV